MATLSRLDEAINRRLNPQLPALKKDLDYEELYPPEPYDLQTTDVVLMSIGCATALLCIVAIVLIFVNLCRDLKLKSWRLYTLAALTVLAWLTLTLYQEHFDLYYVQEIHRSPQIRSVYWCFRNLAHGLSLYLIVLLLSHLSDFQHHGSWLALISTVIVVPLVYSVVLLVIDMHVPPETREHWVFRICVATANVVLYNVATTVLVLVFSRRLCTRRRYGTYSEHKSPLVVLVARWTYFFLVLHNLAAIAQYGAYVATTIPTSPNPETTANVHRLLKEIQLLLIVFSVPTSYVVAAVANCCCGVDDQDDNVEMDKIYSEVWTPGSGSSTTQIQKQPLPIAKHGGVSKAPSSNPNGTATDGNNSLMSGRTSVGGSVSTISSAAAAEDSVSELPSVSRGQRPRGSSRNKNRQSYLEAMSVGSFEDNGLTGLNKSMDRSDRHSVSSSEPIDL